MLTALVALQIALACETLVALRTHKGSFLMRCLVLQPMVPPPEHLTTVVANPDLVGAARKVLNSTLNLWWHRGLRRLRKLCQEKRQNQKHRLLPHSIVEFALRTCRTRNHLMNHLLISNCAIEEAQQAQTLKAKLTA